jgi:hypothetical protein
MGMLSGEPDIKKVDHERPPAAQQAPALEPRDHGVSKLSESANRRIVADLLNRS